jgi:hypothetical protein
MVGIVVVSHSSEFARGLADLAGQMAGPLDDVVRAAERARRTKQAQSCSAGRRRRDPSRRARRRRATPAR